MPQFSSSFSKAVSHTEDDFQPPCVPVEGEKLNVFQEDDLFLKGTRYVQKEHRVKGHEFNPPLRYNQRHG